MQPKLRLEGVLTNVRDGLTPDEGIALDSLPRWLRDLIDINNEMADRDTGRVKRFLSSSADDGPDSEKQKEERHFNALMRLLQDPEYARLYMDAVNTVNDIEDAAARALAKLTRDGEIAADKLDEIRSSAAELPDGRKVFRAADGRIYTEDGEDVTNQRDAVRGLSDASPSWEEFKRAKDALDDIERRKREIDDYLRNVIDPFKRRLADPDNPITPEELRKFKRDAPNAAPAGLREELEKARASGPDAELPQTAPAKTSAADEYVPAASVNAPDAFAQFRSASSVLGSDPFAPQPGGPKPV